MKLTLLTIESLVAVVAVTPTGFAVAVLIWFAQLCRLVIVRSAGLCLLGLAPGLVFAQAITLPWQNTLDGTKAVLSAPGSVQGVYIATQSCKVVSASNNTIRVYDWNGNLVATGTATVSVPQVVGHYFAEEPTGDRMGITVLASSFAGMPDVGFGGVDMASAVITQRVGVLRPGYFHWYASWNSFETNSGAFNPNAIHVNYLTNAVALGLKILSTFSGWPTNWVTAGTFQAGFTNHVQNVLATYGSLMNRAGDLAEVWNEPGYDAGFTNVPAHFPTATSQTAMVSAHVALAALVKTRLTAAGSPLIVAGPTLNSYQAGETAEYAASNLTASITLWTGHDYDVRNEHAIEVDPSPGAKEALWVRTALIVSLFPDDAKAMTEVGLWGNSGLGFPTAVGFGGYSGNHTTVWWRAANRFVKYSVIAKSVNMLTFPHILMANGGNGTNDEWAGWECATAGDGSDARGLRPNVAAFVQAQHRLNGCAFLSNTISTATGTNLFQYYFRQTNGVLLTVMWCKEGSSTNLAQSGATDVWGNSYGGALTEQPRFFTQWDGAVEP